MNCLISDAPAWRAIATLFDDITGPAEIVVLTSDIHATDLARHVLTHPAAARCQITVISERSQSVDPAVDLIVRDNFHHAWLGHTPFLSPKGRFHANIVLVNIAGRVSAAVGSAPLLGNRWASDREIWAVLRERCGCSPMALHELAEMVCVLALEDTEWVLEPHAAFSLYAAARDIETTEAVDTGARLVSNYHHPIAGQLSELITGPVDDLALYTPNFDARLCGVDTLVDIFQPTGTITLYTTERIALDDEMITQRLSADGETRSIYTPAEWSSGTSLDATVIQCRTGAQTFALTGLSAIDHHTLCLASHLPRANFETAVLSQADRPLLPWSTDIDVASRARVLPVPAIETRCA